MYNHTILNRASSSEFESFITPSVSFDTEVIPLVFKAYVNEFFAIGSLMIIELLIPDSSGVYATIVLLPNALLYSIVLLESIAVEADTLLDGVSEAEAFSYYIVAPSEELFPNDIRTSLSVTLYDLVD